MNVVKERLKGLIYHVRVMILKLLGSLDGDEVVKQASEAVNFIFVVAIRSIA